MKLFKVTVILAGLALLPWLVRRYRTKYIPIQNDVNKRYDINDYLAEQGL